MEYDNEGYLPEAMINYLARLGWSHGDDELFSREQLVSWFDTRHLSKSASQWDPKKLNWVNAHYIKQMDDAELAERVARAWPSAAATRKRPTCPASWACLRTAPKRWNSSPTAPCCSAANSSRPRRAGRTPDAGRARGAGGLRTTRPGHRMDPRGAVRADQGRVGRPWPEDAAAGHSAARGGGGPDADAGGGRRAGAAGQETVLARLASV